MAKVTVCWQRGGWLHIPGVVDAFYMRDAPTFHPRFKEATLKETALLGEYWECTHKCGEKAQTESLARDLKNHLRSWDIKDAWVVIT